MSNAAFKSETFGGEPGVRRFKPLHSEYEAVPLPSFAKLPPAFDEQVVASGDWRYHCGTVEDSLNPAGSRVLVVLYRNVGARGDVPYESPRSTFFNNISTEFAGVRVALGSPRLPTDDRDIQEALRRLAGAA